MNIYSEPYTYEGQCCQWCECSGGGPVSVPGAAHGAAPYTGHAVAAALAVTVGGQRPLGHQLARAVSPEQGGIFLVLGCHCTVGDDVQPGQMVISGKKPS